MRRRRRPPPCHPPCTQTQTTPSAGTKPSVVACQNKQTCCAPPHQPVRARKAQRLVRHGVDGGVVPPRAQVLLCRLAQLLLPRARGRLRCGRTGQWRRATQCAARQARSRERPGRRQEEGCRVGTEDMQADASQGREGNGQGQRRWVRVGLPGTCSRCGQSGRLEGSRPRWCSFVRNRTGCHGDQTSTPGAAQMRRKSMKQARGRVRKDEREARKEEGQEKERACKRRAGANAASMRSPRRQRGACTHQAPPQPPRRPPRRAQAWAGSACRIASRACPSRTGAA
jgi:hypothetical protein